MDAPSSEIRDRLPGPDDPELVRRRKLRRAKDVVARYGIAVGGVGVIIAVVLIFFYLLYVVLPMFMPASMEGKQSYVFPDEALTLDLAMEEQAEVGVRFLADATVVFFDVANGGTRAQFDLPMPEGTAISTFGRGTVGAQWVAFGTGDGRVLVAKHAYDVSYPDNRRLITPKLEYPLGEESIVLDEQGGPLRELSLSNADDGSALIAGVSADGRLVVAEVDVEQSLLGEMTTEIARGEMVYRQGRLERLAVSGDQRWVYATDDQGHLVLIDVSDPERLSVIDRKPVLRGKSGEQVTVLQRLLGGVSVLIGTSEGAIQQWFFVRDEQNDYFLGRVREFDSHEAAIVAIEPEARRKGFAAVDAAGVVGLHHATAERTVLMRRATEAEPLQLAMAPRSDKLLLQSPDGVVGFDVHNEHPDISFKALWGKVWYEGYQQPEYIWQSSAANQDFEPKFSLTPLAFGTLKAAFYAMIIAVPLAIMGAIFTAYFMRPAMRKTVKPTIEIMEALPTVILGFLAGLWLAPFIENHLPGTFALLLFMPLGILMFGFGWRQLPKRIRGRVPEGWQAALLIPAVAFIGWFSFAVSPLLESGLFAGDFRGWLTNDLGVDYDQRNSIVVGFAMGFAVIPTIFSITEDAIFGVPKHLSFGSLALGATPWQTLVRVVLPSASPGIFSAVMIGLGRAVGETMIVLMATGNTPVMDANIFEGMRTLSANIAVEMPESEVGSTHYRVLFLAALVLFLFTFVLNTAAELVRQRLRRKYASL